MHSYYSDGLASPDELLKAAVDKGLSAIAITDHETTQGSREGQMLAADYGVELVPAIEITTYWDGYMGHGYGPDVDVLGYFIDLDNSSLAQAEAKLFEGIKARAEASCDQLRSQGYPINLEDVLATSPSYPAYMAHVRTLMKTGQVGSRQEASEVFGDIWLRSGSSALSMAEGIQVIKEAGGVAVLAHPSIVRRQSDGEPISERGVMELIEMGLDGIEVFHYRLDERQRRHFAMLAKMFRLAISGGSDEHGPADAFRRFGSEPVSFEMLEALRARASQRETI